MATTSSPTWRRRFLFGDDGNDVISMGSGIVLALAAEAATSSGPDAQEVFGGEGNDFILATAAARPLDGQRGRRLIEGGKALTAWRATTRNCSSTAPSLANTTCLTAGNDTDYDGESGDDIMSTGPRYSARAATACSALTGPSTRRQWGQLDLAFPLSAGGVTPA
jgi:hypothetical protein